MAREFRAFACTIPKGTAKASPTTIGMDTSPRILLEAEFLVPPGPNGLVGFQLGMAGQQLIPYNAGAFIVANDEVIRWPIEGAPTSGAWQLIGYNTGSFDHTIYVRLLLDIPGEDVITAPMTASNADLSSPPDSSGIVAPDGMSPPPLPAPLQLPPLDLPPLPAIPPPPPLSLPGAPGAAPRAIIDTMPQEVVSETVVVTTAPYDILLNYNPSKDWGSILVRNPGAAHVDGTLVAVSWPAGTPLGSHDFHLDGGQGDEWYIGGLTQDASVVLQSTSGPVSVSFKLATK